MTNPIPDIANSLLAGNKRMGKVRLAAEELESEQVTIFGARDGMCLGLARSSGLSFRSSIDQNNDMQLVNRRESTRSAKTKAHDR